LNKILKIKLKEGEVGIRQKRKGVVVITGASAVIGRVCTRAYAKKRL
jgi:hypothetical protein